MQPEVRIGPFTLRRRLAAGGFGEVWRGTHASSGLPVAVKVITQKNARNPERYLDFRREVQAAARLNHAQIIVLFDYGTIDAEDLGAYKTYPTEGGAAHVTPAGARGFADTDFVLYVSSKNSTACHGSSTLAN